jgi:hypothetical protein
MYVNTCARRAGTPTGLPRENNLSVLDEDCTADLEHFKTVDIVGRVDDPYSRADEHFDLYLCQDLFTDLHTLWTKIKTW